MPDITISGGESFNIAVDGSPIPVYLGENTALAAQYAADAAAQVALVNAQAAIVTAARDETLAAITGTVDPITLADEILESEFAGGAVGDFWLVDKANLWQDTARTIPVTAVGDKVACIDSGRGNRDMDFIQATLAKQGTYQEVMGRPCVRRALGQGYASRATVTPTVPSFIGHAGTVIGANARYLVGWNKNSNSRHVLAPGTIVRMSADTDFNAPDPARQRITANSADGSGPKEVATVYTSLLGGGKVDCVVEDSTFRGQVVELATDVQDGDSAAGSWLVMGAVNNTTVYADAGGDFYGSIIKFGNPTNREMIVSALQSTCRPEIRPSDRVILIVSDSIGDDIDTSAQQIEEMYFHWAKNSLPTSHAGETIAYRRWTANADTLIGYQVLANESAASRTFVINCARSGSQPDYFLAERFHRAIGWLPKVDTVIMSHGHNFAVSDTDIRAQARDDVYRAGIFIQAIDALRAAFPEAQHMIVKMHPVSSAISPTDVRMDSVNEAVDHVADLYGDMQIIDLFTAFDTYSPPRSPTLYAGDGLHHSALGATVASPVIEAAYDSFANVPSPTPPLIAQRKIAYTENLLTNGGFETFTGGVPDGWAAYGGATVTRTNERINRGQTVKVSGSSGGISQTIDCTALQGKVVALTVVGLTLADSHINTGALVFECNGGATIGDGRWSQPPYRSEEGFMVRNHFFPVPATATTLTVKITAGIGAAGTIYLDRVILSEGEIPRDFIL